MEFDKVIKERKSCREFKTDGIEKEKILSLVEAARLSPSAANRQPWKFVIATGKKKEEIATLMEKELEGKDAKEVEDPTEQYIPVKSLYYSIKAIRQAPVLIVVLREKDERWLCGDYLSIGSAVEHISLKATDLGLGSLWLRDVVYTADKIAECLEGKEKEVVVAIAIGYDDEEPYPRVKKSIEEIMRWYE